jgi:hypothetical protein
MGQDLVCMLAEKFLEKVKVRQTVSQKSRVCWRQVSQEKWAAIHYFKGAQEGRALRVALMWAKAKGKS